MTSRILKIGVIAALALTALACNGDDAPTSTPSQTERAPTPSPSNDTPTPRLTAAPAAKGWRTLAPMPTPRSEVAVAALDGRIYVIGGFEGDGSPSDAVEVYDPVTDSWTQAPPLPEPRHHAAATASFDGKLYVVGGYKTDFSDPQKTLFVLDPSTNAWIQAAEMPTARGGHAASVFLGEIYAIGGADADGENIPSVEVYDPATDTWRSGSELGTPRDHLAAASTVECAGDLCAVGLYAIGGRRNVDFARNVDANEQYDPTSKAWAVRAPLPMARSGIAAAALGGRIYVFGGEASSGTFDENDAYDRHTDTWQTLEPMPTARHGLGAAVVGDTIYVIGGGPTPGLSVSGVNEAFTP